MVPTRRYIAQHPPWMLQMGSNTTQMTTRSLLAWNAARSLLHHSSTSVLPIASSPCSPCCGAHGDGSYSQVEPLAALDHDEIEYPEFGKNFYEAVPAIVNMTEGEVRAIHLSIDLRQSDDHGRHLADAYVAAQVNTVRRQLALRVSGFDVPRPVQSFGLFGFDTQLLAVIKRAGYEKPTGIQSQALPAALSGRDVLVPSTLLPHSASTRSTSQGIAMLNDASQCCIPHPKHDEVRVDLCRALQRLGLARRQRSYCPWSFT